MSRPRRRRYTVTVQSMSGQPVKFVILAYDGAGARRFYERQGYTVVSVAEGDHRVQAARASQQPTGAKVIPAALNAAVNDLGLGLPVEIHYTSRQGSVRGSHGVRPTGPGVTVKGNKVYGIDSATGFKHRIMLKSYLTAEQMSRTLHHELAHAMQFERDVLSRKLPPRAALRLWHTSYADGTSYVNKPYEVEARRHEDNPRMLAR